MPRRILVFLDGFFIVIALIVPLACSVDSKLSDFMPEAHAQEADFKKKDTCTKDSDCRAYNQDCCGDEAGIIVAHRHAARLMAKKTAAECAKKRAEANAEKRDLCQDKKPHPRSKYPNVGCDNGTCIIKASGAEPDKSACTNDAQCEIFDPDCCNSGDNVIAMNSQFGASERHKKMTECREKLKSDPRMCKSTRPFVFNKPTAACLENRCTVKK
jgi:hypothetical protein